MLKTGIITIDMRATVNQKRSSIERATGPDGSISLKLLRLQPLRFNAKIIISEQKQHLKNKFINLYVFIFTPKTK